jgi:hypothetical protein
MNSLFGAAIAVGLMACAGAAGAQVRDASFVTPGGGRTLQEWIDISGPIACVWRQVADEATIKASGIAVVHLDLRNGGLLEEGFTADAKPADMIRHQVITYIPERLLVLRNISTPPGLAGAELYPSIVQVIMLEPRDGAVTRFTIAHTGYGPGTDYGRLFAFFHEHNGDFLLAAKKACERG